MNTAAKAPEIFKSSPSARLNSAAACVNTGSNSASAPLPPASRNRCTKASNFLNVSPANASESKVKFNFFR